MITGNLINARNHSLHVMVFEMGGDDPSPLLKFHKKSIMTKGGWDKVMFTLWDLIGEIL